MNNFFWYDTRNTSVLVFHHCTKISEAGYSIIETSLFCLTTLGVQKVFAGKVLKVQSIIAQETESMWVNVFLSGLSPLSIQS